MLPPSLLTLLLCLAGHGLEGRADDFRPISVPLPSSARYWEDALRHSVYLTIVRDKIDELVRRGQRSAPAPRAHALWDKIRDASFERLGEERDAPLWGVVARGRLFDEGRTFRFVEDETSGRVCADPACMEGVRALWSVKRNRADPDEDRFELTFSVVSRTDDASSGRPDRPIRTFTVREEESDKAGARDTRAVWFHRNIVPEYRDSASSSRPSEARSYDPDRIFSTFFADDEPAPRMPPLQKYSKFGKAPHSVDRHKTPISYGYVPYKTTYAVKNGRHPATPGVNRLPHRHSEDGTGIAEGSSPPTSSTRSPLLPTPLPTTLFGNAVPPRADPTNIVQRTMNVTKDPERTPAPAVPIRPPMRVSYVAERVRPPVYNAPPGVFVTMDKKPFKPMPPLRIQPYVKTKKPTRFKDFRPSPQVLDFDFSEPDPLGDTAFKPINPFTDAAIKEKKRTNHTEKLTNETDVVSTPRISESGAQEKPSTERVPDKIATLTVPTDSVEELESTTWASLLRAFSKTTPMASEKETVRDTTTTTERIEERLPELETLSRITTPDTITTRKATRPPATTSTTRAPKRRRPRPPHKYKNNKKDKTVNSTTTEKSVARRPSFDTDSISTSTAASAPVPVEMSAPPRAVTAATAANPRVPFTITTAHTPVATSVTVAPTTAAPTTAAPTTATYTTAYFTPVVTTYVDEAIYSTLHTTTKFSNRYRQSTLMQKGTSVNHDKWSGSGSENRLTGKTSAPWTTHHTPRRNASNFHGHGPVTAMSASLQADDDSVYTYATSSERFTADIETTTVRSTGDTDVTESDLLGDREISMGIQEDPHYMRHEEDDNFTRKNEPIENDGGLSEDNSKSKSENDTKTSDDKKMPTVEKMNTTEPQFEIKNKTKCHKKKKQNATDDKVFKIKTETVTTTTSTESATSVDILNDLFNVFTDSDAHDSKTSSNTSPNGQDYDYIEGARSIFEKHSTFDSDDVRGGEELYHNIQHKADYEGDGEEGSPLSEETYDEELSASGEGRHDLPYNIFDLFFNETLSDSNEG